MNIMSLKKQHQLKDVCLNERLDTIVPKVLKQQDKDMWIVVQKEYHEDYVFRALAPASFVNARRIMIFAFVRVEEEFKRFSLSMPYPDLEGFYEPFWDYKSETQEEALGRLVELYKPSSIVFNTSKNFHFADGLTHGLYRQFYEALPIAYQACVVEDAMIPIKIMELRTVSEVAHLEELMKVAFDIMEETFSSKSMEVGKTTCADLEWHMQELSLKMGVPNWFTPTVDLIREGHDGVLYGEVIQGGDLLHCDFGISYLNLSSDTQRLAYVKKDKQDTIPTWMQEGFKINNRFQDIVAATMQEGKTGNQVLKEALAQAKQEGIDACLYSHPCNMYGHGPGPTIGLWNNQQSIPFEGDLPLSFETTFALELNIKHEHEGIIYPIFSEETVYFNESGLHFLYPGRDRIYMVEPNNEH